VDAFVISVESISQEQLGVRPRLDKKKRHCRETVGAFVGKKGQHVRPTGKYREGDHKSHQARCDIKAWGIHTYLLKMGHAALVGRGREKDGDQAQEKESFCYDGESFRASIRRGLSLKNRLKKGNDDGGPDHEKKGQPSGSRSKLEFVELLQTTQGSIATLKNKRAGQ